MKKFALAPSFFALSSFSGNASLTASMEISHGTISESLPQLASISTNLPASITIETLSSHTAGMTTIEAVLAGALVVALGLGLFLTIQIRHVMRHLYASQRLLQDLSQHQPQEDMSKAVGGLCDRNQLVRLASIQKVAAAGLKDTATLTRAATILEAYVKALTSDGELKKTAKPEIMACLRELSTLNQHHPELIIDLQGVNLQGMQLRHLHFARADFSGANLRQVLCSDVNFTGAILRSSMLEQADFRHCVLTNIDTSHTDWRQTQVSDCQGFTVPNHNAYVPYLTLLDNTPVPPRAKLH